MLFDLRTHKSAIEFLSQFTSIEENDIFRYLLEKKFNLVNVDFINDFNIDIDEISVENVTYVVSHVTSSNDELNSIKSLGIRNLQEVLSVDTPLSKFLRGNDIHFDIANKKMMCKGISYDIDFKTGQYYEHNSLNEKLNSIGHKIYYDFQTSGFLLMRDEISYGGRVHERPEFLFNISSLCNKNLEIEWEQQSKSYTIDFEVLFEELEYFTFYDSLFQFEDDCNSYLRLKKKLIDLSLRRSVSALLGESVSEIFAYLKPSTVIPFTRFVDLREIVY